MPSSVAAPAAVAATDDGIEDELAALRAELEA
ncbi:hypothetical protein LzC2_37440 [Planctomycetes bacterium LzC2]|uniref:Uncharacterized protein n=1 Tax=Alienimonas chondri TaxID=2681879 RepID=A0ABX1VIN7_9PLAN|nr:hypothetical protein [Alienimonas chondri]